MQEKEQKIVSMISQNIWTDLYGIWRAVDFFFWSVSLFDLVQSVFKGENPT